MVVYLQADIEAAIQTIKKAMVVCSKCRRKFSMLDAITRSSSRNNYNDLTEGEYIGGEGVCVC